MREESVFKKAATAGAEKVLEYFNAPPDKRDSEAAMMGLKAGGNFARLYAAETNRLATQVSAAKAIGLSGDALIPVFEELSGTSVQGFLPNKRERSSGTRKRGK